MLQTWLNRSAPYSRGSEKRLLLCVLLYLSVLYTSKIFFCFLLIQNRKWQPLAFIFQCLPVKKKDKIKYPWSKEALSYSRTKLWKSTPNSQFQIRTSWQESGCQNSFSFKLQWLTEGLWPAGTHSSSGVNSPEDGVVGGILEDSLARDETWVFGDSKGAGIIQEEQEGKRSPAVIDLSLNPAKAA